MADDFAAQREQFMTGLRQVESGGRYNAPPNVAGASGAYQFIKSTWAGYGGYSEAYLAPPEIQDERARQLMGDYFRKFGAWTSVAEAWLGGPGSVGKHVVDPYTKITSDQYVSRVMSASGLGGKALPSPVPTAPAEAAPTTVAAPAVGDRHDLGTQLSSLHDLLAGVFAPPDAATPQEAVPTPPLPQEVTSGQVTG